MIKIVIDDQIGGWGITEGWISEKLRDIAEGEEIEIVINSPGGSVYEGIAIFNTIRELSKSHTVNVRINGLAASMATYIAIAARTVNNSAKVTVSENSIFMIHNPWSVILGDYKQMKKEADILERLAVIFASSYSAVSKQENKKIRSAMDTETWYIGKEIIDGGFANNFESVNPSEEEESDIGRDILIIDAKTKLNAVMTKLREESKPEDIDKVAALIGNNKLGGGGEGGAGSQAKKPEAAGTPPLPQCFNNTKPGDTAGGKGGKMTPEELAAQDPELYKSVFALGEKSALDQERKRVNAHLKLGEQSGSLSTAAKYIREGVSVQDDEVFSEYQVIAMKNNNLKDRLADNPGGINPGGDEEEVDEAKAVAAFEAGYLGKETGGKK